MPSVFDVADYFLSLVKEEDGELMSNLKLQKLVYYAQGYHLAIFDKPLFTEPIEAWIYGPVVPELYHTYKQHVSGVIPPPDSVDLLKFDEETIELLDEVYDVIGQFSAWRLAAMTHSEPPWQDTPQGGTISLDAMKEHFKTQIV